MSGADNLRRLRREHHATMAKTHTWFEIYFPDFRSVSEHSGWFVDRAEAEAWAERNYGPDMVVVDTSEGPAEPDRAPDYYR